jgi:hypothetical protein
MLSRVENHEDLVERALVDDRDKLTRVQGELARVRRRAALLDQAWRSAIDEQQGWLERARTHRVPASLGSVERSHGGAASRARKCSAS